MNQQTEQEVMTVIANLEAALAEDQDGKHARQLMAYFAQGVAESSSLVANAQGPEERSMALQLVTGMQAAQRVIQRVWESRHGATLQT